MSTVTAQPGTGEPASSGFGYHPALDGVRALAIVAVIGVHVTVLPGGGIGVLIFFVLSGFLITSLLLDERRRYDGISLRLFYTRRALRLFPALVVVVLTALVVALSDLNALLARPTLHFIPAVLLYVGNWLRARHSYFVGGALAHTWSLSVEEQFYIVWAVVLAGLLARGVRLRTIALIALLGAAASDAGKLIVWSGGTLASDANRMYGTDLSGDALMLGCALAIAVLRRPELTRRIARLLVAPATIFLAVVIVFVHPLGLNFGHARLFEVAVWPMCNVASAIVIAYLVLSPRSLLARTLSIRPLRFTGRISYGLYLWHYPIFVWLFVYLGFTNRWWQVPIEVGLASVAAVGSYYLIERPALRVKDTLVRAPRPGPTTQPPPLAGGGMEVTLPGLPLE